MNCNNSNIVHKVRVFPATENLCNNVSAGLNLSQQFDIQKNISVTCVKEKTWILKYLYYTGIPIFSTQRDSHIYRCYFIYCWFPILMHIALVINTTLLILETFTDVYGLKIVFSCVCFNFLSVAVWHYIYQVKDKLVELFETLQQLCSLNLEFSVGRFEVLITNGVLLTFSLIPTIFSVTSLYLISDSPIDTFWIFGYKLEHFFPWGKLLLFVNVNLYISLQVVFPGLVTSVYCSHCHRFSKLIIYCSKNLERKDEETHNVFIKQKVSQYLEILAGIESMQNTFSRPMFLLVLMHLLHMFTLLAYLISFTNEQFTYLVIGESIVIMTTSFLSLCAVVLFASKIPDNIQKVRQMYQRYQENAVLKLSQKRNEVAQLAIDREVIVMSASDVVYFKKSFILSVIGALLTYGLLILQFHK